MSPGSSASRFSGGGYVYKITRTMPKVVIKAGVTFATGSALVARWSTTKPTSSQISSTGTQMWSTGSNASEGGYAAGTKVFTNVIAGTYFWIYPSANDDRAASNREFFFATGDAAADVVSFASGTLSAGDAGSTTDPIDFGAVTASGIAQETLGSGKVYKTTKPFAALSIDAAANFSASATLKGRYAATAPTTANLTTHGTEILSDASNSSNSHYAFDRAVITAAATGTYFWFYPSASVNATNRVLGLDGVHAVQRVSGTVYDSSESGADTGSTDDPIDFGTDSSGDGIAREALGSGYVYKTTRAFSSLYISASADLGTGAAFRARSAATAPTTANLTTHGSELWGANSYDSTATAHGNKALFNVPSGTYFWVYPSAQRTSITNRELLIAEGVGSDQVLSYESSTLAAADAASATDPIDFGAVTTVNGLMQETLGSGKVYKTTKKFSDFSVAIKGTYSVGGTIKGRYAATAPDHRQPRHPRHGDAEPHGHLRRHERRYGGVHRRC